MKKISKKIINIISCFLMVMLILCCIVLKPIHYIVCAIFNLLHRQIDALMDEAFNDE